MKNNKGFTLIELMIAIAIIGILALVLIPRVAGLKDNARAAGLDSTIRVAMSITEGVIDNYKATPADCQALETYLNTKLPINKAENPYTKNTTSHVESYYTEALAGQGAFAYADGAADEDDPEDFTAITNLSYLKGVVLFDAFVDTADGNKLKVKFQGVDGAGALVGTAKVTN